ncbi:hypothetical protein Agub_g902, partial [Astrephomene gubernaculifera]
MDDDDDYPDFDVDEVVRNACQVSGNPTQPGTSPQRTDGVTGPAAGPQHRLSNGGSGLLPPYSHPNQLSSNTTPQYNAVSSGTGPRNLYGAPPQQQQQLQQQPQQPYQQQQPSPWVGSAAAGPYQQPINSTVSGNMQQQQNRLPGYIPPGNLAAGSGSNATGAAAPSAPAAGTNFAPGLPPAYGGPHAVQLPTTMSAAAVQQPPQTQGGAGMVRPRSLGQQL